MNIHQTAVPSPKRKLNGAGSEAESKTLSHRRLRKSPRKPTTNAIKPLPPLTGRVARISQVEPSGSTSTRRRRIQLFSLSSSKAGSGTLARPLRILSRHIRHCQVSPGDSNSNSNSDLESTSFSLTRIPSIMDVYLDAKSPSIDFTEEVLLEIADRSRRLSWLSSPESALGSSHSTHNHREYRLCDGSLSSLSSEVSGLNLSRKVGTHPDSFERSTAAWSEGLNGQ